MSRVRLDQNYARGVHQNSSTYGNSRMVLNGVFTIPLLGPNLWFLDANGANRTVFLPAIPPQGGQEIVIANMAVTGNLLVVDANGVAVQTITPTNTVIFYSYRTGWRAFTGGSAPPLTDGDKVANALAKPPVLVGAGPVNMLPSDVTILLLFDNPSTTLVNLPTSVGRVEPVRIVDFSLNVVEHTITLDPFGSEVIMRSPTWDLFSTAAQLSSITLWPSAAVGGWYVAP